MAATAVPWTDDADVGAWPMVLDNVRARDTEADVVVPGHGRPGELLELLEHTRDLLAG